MGGEGILCFQKDGKCPQWAIQAALRYPRQGDTPRRAFANDEQLLEAMRV